MDLLVPRLEHVGQAVPHLRQPAVGDLQLQVLVEHIDDLPGGDAQAVVQPGRECDGAVAQGAVGQGVGDLGFDLLLAARTPVAVDRVLGNVGLQVVGDVFDDAGAGASGAGESAAAGGAGGELVRFAAVDVFGSRSCGTRVAGSGTALLTPWRCGRLGVGRDGTGRLVGTADGCGEPRAALSWRSRKMTAARSTREGGFDLSRREGVRRERRSRKSDRESGPQASCPRFSKNSGKGEGQFKRLKGYPRSFKVRWRDK